MATSVSVDAFVAGAWGILGAFCLIGGLAQLRGGLASRSWNTVSGEIIESRVRYVRSGFWLAEIRYRYTIEGFTYEGDRFGFGKGSFFSRGAAERVVSMYPKGHTFTLPVSPADRSVAVIEPGVGWGVWMFFAVALLAALGVGSSLL